MKLISLIEEYEKKLEQPSNHYSCLLFALQLPSICSRIEFPQTNENTGAGKLYKNGGTPYDSNMYKEWIIKHSNSFIELYETSMTLSDFCKILYDLRCKITHEGILMDNKSNFYFIEEERIMYFDNIVFLSIKFLCEKIFEAAKETIFNTQKNIEISLFKDKKVSKEKFLQIQQDVAKKYYSFWENFSNKDNMLNCIYDHLILDDPNMEQEINMFFENNPDKIYEIWGFDEKDRSIIDPQQTLIKLKYDKNKSKILENSKKSYVLCLSKEDYKRMLFIHRELENYSKSNSFDITKYL